MTTDGEPCDFNDMNSSKGSKTYKKYCEIDNKFLYKRGVCGPVDKGVSIPIWKLMVRFPHLSFRIYWLIISLKIYIIFVKNSNIKKTWKWVNSFINNVESSIQGKIGSEYVK